MKVYYWKGIFGDEYVIREYSELIQKLLDGDYKSADLEKLTGYDVFSARLSDTHRILLVQTTVYGVSYLLIVEVVLNHRYDKSKALNNPQFLKKFKEAQTVALEAEIKTFQFQKAHEHPLLVEPTQTPIEYVKAHWQLEKFIILTDVQGEISKVVLPALVEGPPGSGKSSDAQVILDERDSQTQDLSEKPMLYLTESPKLLENMSNTWANMGEHFQKVEFKTWDMLMQTVQKEIKNLTPVGQKEFITWLKDYVARYKKRTKNCSQEMSTFLQKSEEIYLECRIIKAFIQNKEAYYVLGQMQSIFTKRIEREWLFKTCTDYIIELTTKKQYDPAFYTITPHPYYQFICVDEAQDLSINQLIQLSKLVDNEQILYLLDTKQTINHNPHIRSLLIDCIPIDKNSRKKLGENFRNSKSVVDLLNAVIQIIFIISEGKVYKDEYTKVQCASDVGLGDVLWIDEINEKMQEKLTKAALSKEFAVIIPDFETKQIEADLKNKIKNLFGAAKIYTISESKGLEFDTVLLFDIFDNPRYKEVAQILKNKSAHINHEKVHLTKDKKPKNESLCTEMYQSFVSISRAKKNIIAFSPVSPDLNPLTNRLQEATATLSEKAPTSEWENMTATSMEEWLEEVKKSILEEQNETALRILTIHLHKTSEDFIHIYQSTWEEKISSLVSKGEKNKALTLYITKLKGKKEEFLRKHYGEEVKTEPPQSNEKKPQNTNAFFKPVAPQGAKKESPKEKKARKKAQKKQLQTTTPMSTKPETTVPQNKETSPPKVVVDNDVIKKNYDLHKKHLAFVDDLITPIKFNEGNLHRIFKNSNLNLWLFDTISRDGCLFTRIFSNIDLVRTLKQFLSSNPTLIQKINSKKLWELLKINMNDSKRLPIFIGMIMREDIFFDFFLLLLKEHPDFTKDIDVELISTSRNMILPLDIAIDKEKEYPAEWKASFELHTTPAFYSPLFLLTNTKAGIEACRAFKLWDKVPEEAFFIKAKIKHYNTMLDLNTPFCNILQDSNGVAIWQELVASRNSLAIKMTAADLIFIPYSVHVEQNQYGDVIPEVIPKHSQMPFRKLIVRDALECFDLLDTLNPNMMQGIPLDTLCWSSDVGHPCALHYLTNYRDAFYLQKWIKLNPEEFKELPDNAFFLKANLEEYASCWNATPIAHLIMSPEKQMILLKIVKEKPSILKLFTKHTLCQPYLLQSVALEFKATIGDVVSPLFELTVSVPGIQLLSLIFEANKSLITEIDAKVWGEQYVPYNERFYIKHDSTSQELPRSAAFNLTTHESPLGKKIFNLLPSEVKRAGTRLQLQHIHRSQEENTHYLNNSPF